MTVDRALTAEERHLSQTAMRDQSFLGSLAMNCGGTFWVFVVTGGLMGVCGMIFNPLIFKLLQIFGNGTGMDLFRSYFLVTAILFAGLIFAPFSLVLKKRNAD